MTTRTASCSCGEVQVEVQGEPLRVSVCHCLACQQRTGSVFSAQARFARAGFSTRGATAQYVRVGDGGTKCEFNFCPRCGATVYFVPEGQDDMVVVPVGAFADPAFPSPTVSVYEDRKHAWLQMPARLEHIP